MISMGLIKTGMIPVSAVYNIQKDNRRNNNKGRQNEGRKYSDILSYLSKSTLEVRI